MRDVPRSFDLLVLAPLGFAVLAYQLAEPAEVIPPLALVACIAGRLVQEFTGWVLGRAAIGIAVGAAIAYVILDVSRAGFDVNVFADFMMILAALKAFERRTPRDDGQLLVVSIFVALAAAVSSNRIGTGGLLVLYVFALMLAVMRVQIDAAMWPQKVERRGGLWQLLAASVVGSTAVAILAFVLLPRSNARFTPVGLSPVTQRVSGFRESVELGTGGLISQDPREVMRVSLVDAGGASAGEFQVGDVIYLRGRVLSNYEQESGTGRWSPVDAQSAWEPTRVLGGVQVPIGGGRASQLRSLKIIQHPGASGSGTVFSVWRPTRIHFDVATGEVEVHQDDLSLRFRQPPVESFEYRLFYGEQSDSHSPMGVSRSEPLSGSSVIRATATRVLTEAGIEPDGRIRDVADDERAVARLESWLRTSKGYTLDIEPAPRDQDPTEWFIETATQGHCEYFASALALLCRDAGIRSRVVTGYLGIADEGDGAFMRIRRSDAHAWVEAEVRPGVWRAFDATPAAVGQALSPQVDVVSRWLSSLESAWLSSFIAYDARSQSQLSRSLDRALSIDRLRAESNDGGRGAAWFGLRAAGALAALAGCGVVVVLVARRARRGRGLRDGVYDIPADAAEARDQLDERWSTSGIPRPSGISVARHAAAVAPSDALEAERIERLAFGPRE